MNSYSLLTSYRRIHKIAGSFIQDFTTAKCYCNFSFFIPDFEYDYEAEIWVFNACGHEETLCQLESELYF